MRLEVFCGTPLPSGDFQAFIDTFTIYPRVGALGLHQGRHGSPIPVTNIQNGVGGINNLVY
jgi:hypothetical protein